MKKYFTLFALAVLCVLSAFGADDGYRRTWDFTKGWSASTLEIMAQDTEHWTVQGTGFQNTANFSELKAVMTYNGETIPVPELEGLELGAMKKAAHVQIYDGFKKNSSFPDLACLWINGKNKEDYISFKVPAGENVKIGYCSHSADQARGFSVSAGFADAEGNTKFTSKAEGVVVDVELINSNTEESTLKLSSTSGHHIYYIIIGEGDAAEAYTAGYLYAGGTAAEELPLYSAIQGIPNLTINAIKVDAALPTKEEMMAFDAVVLDGSLSVDNAALVAFLKENLYWQPVFNANGKLAEALGLGTAIDMEMELGWAYDAKDRVFEGMSDYYVDSVKFAMTNGEVMPIAMNVTGQSNIDKIVTACGMEDYAVYADSVIAYVYNAGHNQYTYYGVGSDYAAGTEILISNLFSQTLASKTEVTETPKPAFIGDYKEMESIISISCLNKNAVIYYTSDGTDPVVGGNVYTEPITVSTEGVTIKAISVADGYLVSEVNSFDVPLFHQAKMPVISYVGNGKNENAVITITSPEEGVDIWYNFTASEDTLASSKYNGPITLPVSATIHAFALSESLALVQSELASAQILANVEKIRRDELAHFKVSNAGWNTLENLTLDGEAYAAWANGSNYYFSWGKSASESYEIVGDPKTDENGDFIVDENGNFIYDTVEKPLSVVLNSADPDWRLVSRGQVMIYQGNTLGSNIGDGNGYNPERAEDYLEQLGTTADIQFGGVASGDKCTAAIESTKKFAAPFNVVAIIANVASGGRLAVEVSKDGVTWEQVGDTLQTSTVKRLYKKFEVAYEGTDEVYVRLASVKNSSQAVHDIYVFNHGEKSAAMQEELLGLFGIEDVVVPENKTAVKPVKMMKDGQLVIMVGDKMYSVTGARLK